MEPGTQVTPTIRLVRHLQSGGMGSVWVAEHLVLDTKVAVKFISTDVPKKALPYLLERFVREAKTAARIDSPHVVKINDCGVMQNNTPFIVMELLKGESLGDRLEREGTVDLLQTALIVRPVCKALSAAHSLGVVHRDIKPDNIFLVDSQEELLVKVLDFGVAKVADLPHGGGLTKTGSMVGTPFYASPEQMKDAKTVSPQADLWALGAASYHALTGALPFSGDTAVKLWIAKQEGKFTPASELRSGVVAQLDEWFSRALDPDPNARFASAGEMADAFELAVRACGVPTPSQQYLVDTGQHAHNKPGLGTVPAEPALPFSRPSSEDLAHDDIGPVKSPGQLAEMLGHGETPPRRPDPTKEATQPFTREDPGKDQPQQTRPEPTTPLDAKMMEELVRPSQSTTPFPIGVEQQRSLSGASRTLPDAKGVGRSKLVLVALIALGCVAAAAIGIIAFSSDVEDEDEVPRQTVQERGSATPPIASSTLQTMPPPQGMVAVKAGTYSVGCAPGEDVCVEDERPVHEVTLKPFAIMVHEVTMIDYDECVAHGKCPKAGTGRGCTWQHSGKEEHPINCVTWNAAKKYCEHQGWRLPTEEEWEVAARGHKRSKYPWGDEAPSCKLTVLAEAKNGCGTGGPLAVGSRKADRSWVGAFDMGGNVREWTDSTDGAYPGGKLDQERDGKINRGGSYEMNAKQLYRVHTRGVDPPRTSLSGLGFRCAVSL